MTDSITIDTIRAYARPFNLLISEKEKHYLVYRLIYGRPIFQGKRPKTSLRALNSFVQRLSRSVDYENSKCA